MPARQMYDDPFGFFPNYQQQNYYSPCEPFFGGAPVRSPVYRDSPAARAKQTQRKATPQSIPPSFPQQQRGVRIPPKQHAQPNPQKRATRQPRYSPEQLESAAKLIQAAFRRHAVQKQNIIPTLKQLANIKSAVNRSIEKFTNQQSGGKFRGDMLRRMYLQHEEELTKALLRLDEILVRNSVFLRERRKDLVRQINDRLQHLDSQKPEIFARAKQEQLEIQQEREARRKQEELEKQSQSQSDSDPEEDGSDVEISEAKSELDDDSDFVMEDNEPSAAVSTLEEVVVKNESSEVPDQIEQDLLEIQQEQEKLLSQKHAIELALQELESRRQALLQTRPKV